MTNTKRRIIDNNSATPWPGDLTAEQLYALEDRREIIALITAIMSRSVDRSVD